MIKKSSLEKITNIKDIQNILLNMLCCFVEYLDYKKIKYFICGGTLLGAIRHKGFIPWDDDVDLHIFRDDYNKLIELAKQNSTFGKNNEFEMQYPGKRGYIYPFIKVYDKRYPAEDLSFNNDNYYISLDVFPLDHIPEDIKKRKRFVEISNKLRHILLAKRFKRENTKSSKLYWMFKCFLLTIFGGEKKVSLLIEKFAKSTNKKYVDSNLVGNGSWPNDVNDYLNIDMIGDGVEVDFCDKKLVAPIKYDLYLKNRYGDYMTLPPEDKRVSHSLIAYKNISHDKYK